MPKCILRKDFIRKMIKGGGYEFQWWGAESRFSTGTLFLYVIIDSMTTPHTFQQDGTVLEANLCMEHFIEMKEGSATA